MAHPLSKQARLIIAKQKGLTRALGFYNTMNVTPSDINSRKDTTKLSTNKYDGNPRRFYKRRSLQERRWAHTLKLLNTVKRLRSYDPQKKLQVVENQINRFDTWEVE
jgi:hypothetical protein